ncbi:hypothetical protein VN1161_15110 [Helicobacter pylori]|nr:hypothetical protein VN1161_15110 [Helicobacter pylori]
MRQRNETQKRDEKLTDKKRGFKYLKKSLLASLEYFKEKSAFLKRTQTLKKLKGVINA